MPDLGLIIRTIREAGITAPIMGGDSYDDPGLFQALGPQYGNDIYLRHPHLGLARHLPADGRIPEGLQGQVRRTAGGHVGCHRLGRGQDPGAAPWRRPAPPTARPWPRPWKTTTWDLLTGKLKWEDAAKGHETHKEAAMVKLVRRKAGIPRLAAAHQPTRPVSAAMGGLRSSCHLN